MCPVNGSSPQPPASDRPASSKQDGLCFLLSSLQKAVNGPLPQPPASARQICSVKDLHPGRSTAWAALLLIMATGRFLTTFVAITTSKWSYSAAPDSHPKHLELTLTCIHAWSILEIDIFFIIWYVWAVTHRVSFHTHCFGSPRER